ncbi:unnamed protein product [Staurois parvus]|uniref:Uncharacterized protein n=1 Tax=Staurois parvus TaxID=386267 RepID=A0ABN9DAK4_9NEOB|nr:unnamed protein product [Staurois parvus]
MSGQLRHQTHPRQPPSNGGVCGTDAICYAAQDGRHREAKPGNGGNC